jgi:prepilin-type N-terminal cleavage/methylation domain-containing protein
MKRKKKHALTLIELITVMVIISILVVIAVPNYLSSRVKAIDKQGKAIVELLRAAERVYRIELGQYYPTSGSVTSIANINNDLNLDLVADGKWSYVINSMGSGAGFLANMTASLGGSGGTHSWWINSTMDNGSCQNTNPNVPCP